MRIDLTPVSDVVVGDRVRASAGNVLGLAESIGRLGLLNPLVLNSRRELVAGFRRLEAVKKLGWQTVPCRVVDGLDDAVAALQAERDENTCREPLNYEELVAVGRRLEALEKPKAKARKEATQVKGKTPDGKPNIGSGNLPEPTKGQTRDKVAGALGVSGRTYEKAKQVVMAAEADPNRFGDLPDVMEQTSVDAAYREWKARAAHGLRLNEQIKAELKAKPEPKAEPKMPVFDVEKFNRDMARAIRDQASRQLSPTDLADSLEAVSRLLMEEAAEVRRANGTTGG